VTDTGLIVVSSEKSIMLIPATAILRATFEQMGGSTRMRNGLFASAEGRERVRLASRYPQGLTLPLLRRLLDAYGQVDLQVLGR